MKAYRFIPVVLFGTVLAGCAAEKETGEIPPQFTTGERSAKPFILGTKTYPNPDMPLPGKGVTFTDSTFGTKITRVTDPSDKWGPSIGRLSAASKHSPFNANLSLMSVTGGKTWHIYDNRTCKMIRRAPGPGQTCSLRWDPYNPDIYYFTEGTTLKKYDLKTDKASVVHDFKKDFPEMAWLFLSPFSEPSFDYRVWTFSIMGDEGGKNTYNGLVNSVITYDMKADKVLGSLPVNLRGGKWKPHSAAIVSPSGKFVIATVPYAPQGRKKRYNVDFTEPRRLPSGIGGYAMALDTNGREVLVYKGDKTDYIMKHDLASGKTIKLMHVLHGTSWDGLVKFGGVYDGQGTSICGHCYATPGWVLISRYGRRGKEDLWSSHAIYMLKIDDTPDITNPRPWRIATGRAVWDPDRGDHHWAETRGNIDYSGTQIAFSSNWFNPKAPMEAYRIELPAGWYEKLMGREEAERALELAAETLGVTVEVLLRKKHP